MTTTKSKKKSPKKTTKPKSLLKVRATGRIAVHYTADYIIDPPHPVTVNLIGCGGTGSQVLNSLARVNSSLKALGHPGIFVRAIDPDEVSEANMGRQLFSPVDVGFHKCSVLIGRINRFFGVDWEALPTLYNSRCTVPSANITISCVDSGKARKEIRSALIKATKPVLPKEDCYGGHRSEPIIEPFRKPYYWMDYGNMMDRGQVVIGTVQKISQPKNSEFECRETLPTVEKLHPDVFVDRKGDDQGPSCSLAEALQKQDLFINTNLANMGLAILWKLFREAHLKYHGCYLNLDTLSVNAIKV